MEQINKQEVFEDIKKYIQNIYEKKDEILDNIRENNEVNLIIEILDSLTYCIRGINLTSDISNIDIDEEDFKSKMEEMTQAIENQDNNLLMDIFEYEILEIIEKIYTKL
ncbi:MAG: hypothetical protein K2L15_04225 [Eubacteriales bacterium]|nr:hypothetical protein [Eubacteriales bacterium]